MTAPQQTPTIASLFSGGGGKSVSWKDKPLGTTVSGRVKQVHPPQQQTDPATKELKFKKNGQPVLQIRIDMETNERDPQDPEDDGSRSLYVGGWMFGAIGEAVRKVGVQEPAPGGILSVTLSERTPNENPALQGINKFVATYQPPPVSGGMFQAPGQPAAAPPVQNGYVTQAAPYTPPAQQAPPAQQYQQPAPQQQYAPPAPQQAPPAQQYAPPVQQAPPAQQYAPPAPQQQYAPPPAQAPAPQQAPPVQQYAPPAQQAPAAPGPQRPPQISEAAWLQMSPDIQANVAATIGAGIGVAGVVEDPNKPPF